jgi:hypothetical protein
MSSDRFFSVDSPKAIKAQALGWLNAINYMAPASTAGVGNLCPHASPGCLALCLGWYSGQAAMLSNAELETGSNAVRASRVRKAQLFMNDRSLFMLTMFRGIQSCQRKAKREKLKLCVRLNGATDISWEGVRFHDKTMLAAFPKVQFVDYTKNCKRMLRFCNHMLPNNYHLTFSRSETNESECLNVLRAGGNVAVVFDTGTKKRPILFPKTYLGYPVFDGDKSDLRHLDPGGHVIALSPKGRKAQADSSGFVVRS